MSNKKIQKTLVLIMVGAMLLSGLGAGLGMLLSMQ